MARKMKSGFNLGKLTGRYDPFKLDHYLAWSQADDYAAYVSRNSGEMYRAVVRAHSKLEALRYLRMQAEGDGWVHERTLRKGKTPKGPKPRWGEGT